MSRLGNCCHRLLHIGIRCDVVRAKSRAFHGRRSYATHRDHSPSSLLSQQFDQQRNPRGGDGVGPFQLGIVQPSQQKVKKWSELNTGGKVLRTTARATNFSVIIIGAGLSAVLVYALASELFARNSPTVLYGKACEKIQASPQITAYLRTPLSFHNNPPLTHRPRHRNRHVNSLLAVDSAGKEHLLLNFYVQGSDPSVPLPATNPSYMGRFQDWSKSTITMLSTLSSDQVVERLKSTASGALQTLKQAFAYLVGEPLPRLPQPHPKQEFDRTESIPQDPPWTLSGIFTRLTGKRRARERNRHEAVGPLWTTGEVHADFVKDVNGVFVCRYLLVDIPDSNSRNPIRLFVEQTDGVREHEAVIRWTPS
ncbi:hypothetical protein K439DRAFT_1385945 [Ramaria rubella]|nr:hypothetical protein K439DRAFT_1385945 [Ramaria rubella]